jgi:putative transposase
MVSKNKPLLVKHISAEKLNKHIRKLENIAKKVNRLHLIQQLYDGKSIDEASKILKIPKRTAYNWLKKWNEEGLEGLDHKKGAGRPSFLTEEELKKLDDYIMNNDGLGTEDVHYFIQKEFGIDYSLKQVRIIINKLGYSRIKPYPVYDKSPADAEEILKKAASEIDPEKDIYGFFDESSMNNKPNISRVLKKKERKNM